MEAIFKAERLNEPLDLLSVCNKVQTMGDGGIKEIFLRGIYPNFLQCLGIYNRSIRVLIGTREGLTTLRESSEMGHAGVYFLLYPRNEGSNRLPIYVGECNNFSTRIEQHLRQKDGWDDFIFFYNSNEKLNKDQLHYLEKRLYLLAITKAITPLSVLNDRVPRGANLSESDTCAMEDFLKGILRFLDSNKSIRFLDPFERPRFSEEPTINAYASLLVECYLPLPQKVVTPGSPEIAYIATDGKRSILREKSSIRRYPTRTQIPKYLFALQEMTTSRAAIESDNQHLLKMTRDWEFDSLSAAMSIAKGHPINGLGELRRVSDNFPFKT